MSDEIVFEDPPPTLRTGTGVSHHSVARQLRECPGQWGRVGDYLSKNASCSISWNIKAAKNLKAYAPAGAYEATTRVVNEVEDGKPVRRFRVYARYVGES